MLTFCLRFYEKPYKTNEILTFYSFLGAYVLLTFAYVSVLTFLCVCFLCERLHIYIKKRKHKQKQHIQTLYKDPCTSHWGKKCAVAPMKAFFANNKHSHSLSLSLTLTHSRGARTTRGGDDVMTSSPRNDVPQWQAHGSLGLSRESLMRKSAAGATCLNRVRPRCTSKRAPPPSWPSLSCTFCLNGLLCESLMGESAAVIIALMRLWCAVASQ